MEQQEVGGEARALRAGEVVAGRYKLISELGRGSMGVVYRALHEQMNREVAIKTLLPQSAKNERLIGRFKREVQVISALRHPNTVTIYDYGDLPDGRLYFAMEMLEGRSLGSELRRNGPLSPERVRNIVTQILKSLSEAHDKGIIHRDLKPDNIFLESIGGEEDYVKVLDFSIAKALRPVKEDDAFPEELTKAGVTVGTPVYMAPEQFNQEAVGASTDLYALGHMIYEMLGGRPIFQGSSWIEIAMHKLDDRPVKLRDDIICSDLGGVLVKAIQKEPRDRYQSVEQMLKDIEAVGDLSDEPAFPHARHVTSMRAATNQMVVETPFGPRAVTGAVPIIGLPEAQELEGPEEPTRETLEVSEAMLVEVSLPEAEPELSFDEPTQISVSLIEDSNDPSLDPDEDMGEETRVAPVDHEFVRPPAPMVAESTVVESGLAPAPPPHDLSLRRDANPTSGLAPETHSLLLVGLVGLGMMLLLVAIILAVFAVYFGT